MCDDIMEPIIKVNKKKFNDLDEVCMEGIFKFLSLHDLAAISLTCKRCKEEAERYFSLHHEMHCEPIVVRSTNEDVDFEFKVAKKYEKVFETLIRSVDFYCHGSFSVEDCEFIEEYCASQLRSLTLTFVNGRGDEKIDGSPTDVIKSQLKNLKELKLINFIVRDLHKEMLQYCERLESLTIDVNRGGHEEFYGVFGNTWLQQRYPHLSDLKLCVPKYLTVHLRSFLALNPNLKNLTCNNLWFIFDVCQSEFTFQRVTFVFLCENDFTYLMDPMAKWSKQKRFEEFELVTSVHEFAGDVMHAMATTFENITSLHLGVNVDYFVHSDLNVSLPSVKSLCVDLRPCEGLPTPSPQLVYEKLNELFPSLCQLKTNVVSVFGDIFDVVRRFKELKNFQFINEQCDLCLMKYTDLNV